MKSYIRLGFLSFLASLCGFLLLSASTSSAAPAAAAAAPAAEANIGKQVASITVPKGVKNEAVKTCVLRALVARKWQVTDKTDSSAVGVYKRGDNEATVTIKFDENNVTIYCVGKTKKPGELPMRWIENLQKDIMAFLNKEFALK